MFHHERRDHIARYHEQGFLYEQPLIERTLAEVRRCHPHDRGFLDVGAHVGNHAVAFGLSGAFSWGIALEAHPDTVRLLQTNLRTNGVGEVFGYQARAGADTRLVRVTYADPEADNTGMRRVLDDEAGVLAQQIAVDDFSVLPSGLSQMPASLRVGLLKIDVEGDALLVLDGARRLLERDQPVVLVESASLVAVRDRLPLDYVHVVSGGKTPTHLFSARP